MYLKNIVLKNIGPIEELSVELPFKENGDPKPIIFVWENGSGKTILQSQIIDGFYEIGSELFDDIGINDWLKRSFYKISGGINITIGKNSGFSLLKFIDQKNQALEYFDKVWRLTHDDFTSCISDFWLSPDTFELPQKDITTIDNSLKQSLQTEWKKGVYFYQPAYRYEKPFRKNTDFAEDPRFEDRISFSWNLNKELEIISSSKSNKAFLMDLVLDFVSNPQNDIDRITWININTILKKIKRREDIRFWIGPRWGYRVSIVELDEVGEVKKQLLPSIDNLSLGESVLLNLFINIIRHGDVPPKLTDQIQWIVLIDEIDIHLHTDLQNSVLPELIQLFPKVQFIITTHSPLFLLGMKKIFWEEWFEVRKLPKGEKITTERFSEFENAYAVLRETEQFEKDLKEKAISNNRAIVYVEGPTDVKYIKKAYELYDKSCDYFDIEIIGEKTKKGTGNSNNAALKNAKSILSTNLNLLHQKVILLNDPEENIEEGSWGDKLYVRKMNQFENNPLKKGIENLFDESFIKDKVKPKFEDDFSFRVKGKEVVDFKIDKNKQAICDWICQNGTKENFKNFETIFKIIEGIIWPSANNLSN